MGTVNIGISHNDDLVISQFGNIEIIMNTGTKGGNHSLDLRIGVNLIQTGLFHVQNLTAQGQDRLGRAGTGRLGGATCGISLYDVDLAVLRILIGAVCQLSGQSHTIESGLSSGQVAGFSRCLTGTLGQNGFFQNHLGYISCSETTLSTAPRASLLPSFCLV